jgi:signal transduction histidine kinase
MLLRLTEDILDVTKIESQTLKLRQERFNLNDVILNVVKDYRDQIAKDNNSNNNLKLIYECNNIILVEADKQRLTQVISNLLSNSIKFTKRGTITVTKKTKVDDKKEVVISVSDTGTGIDPDILPKLFTKFATKSYQGTGLGLYISKSIVEAHGGKMWAENNNNSNGKAGSTFYFTLPIYENNERQEVKQGSELENNKY